MKIKSFRLSSELLTKLLAPLDIPSDARLMNVRLAWPVGVEIVLCSDSFSELPEGAVPFCEQLTTAQ